MGPSSFADVARFMLINPAARKLVKAADEVLGYSLVDRYRENDGDYSEYAQVAFFVNCLALAGEGLDPEVCTGPSFGGKMAAVYSGALSFDDGVWMTSRWARCLDEYFAEEHGELITHSFARTPPERLGEILAELDARGTWHEISCHVDDDFTMLTLGQNELEWLEKRLRQAGGLPLYSMYPPMHASVFAPLREKMENEVFRELTFSDPALPVIADQDGAVLETGAQVREMLLDGLVRAVRWPDVVAALKARGIGRLDVAGPDRLFGRVPCTTRNFEVVRHDPRSATRPRRR
ncbi:ACP S-malonyltransferase [Actinomadura rudentiformis]|uniref:[acyl-carrier-protein] S-malonyltransferase n=2 Tax=Actinomadura rudentiformis TaxID=359158 RepID=A0A6H9YJE9_9ACTN|nr:ACP S-malonyltransferase [Actinomadura rudentiformis]